MSLQTFASRIPDVAGRSLLIPSDSHTSFSVFSIAGLVQINPRETYVQVHICSGTLHAAPRSWACSDFPFSPCSMHGQRGHNSVSKMLLQLDVQSRSVNLFRQDGHFQVQSVEVPIRSRAYSSFSRYPLSRSIPTRDCATGVVGNPCSTSTHVGDTQQRVAQTSAKFKSQDFL